MTTTSSVAFKLGWVLLKSELSKHESAETLRNLGGQVDETILLQRLAKYYNQGRLFDRPDGLLVVTNHRLVFLAKLKTILATTDYLSFPFELVQDLRIVRVWKVIPAIAFDVQGNPYTFTLLSNPSEMLEVARLAKRALHAAI